MEFNYNKFVSEKTLLKEGVGGYVDLKPVGSPVNEDLERPLDWEDLDDTDISGPGMEMEIDNLIQNTKATIDKLFPNDPAKRSRVRMMIKMLWNEKLRDWKG